MHFFLGRQFDSSLAAAPVQPCGKTAYRMKSRHGIVLAASFHPQGLPSASTVSIHAATYSSLVPHVASPPRWRLFVDFRGIPLHPAATVGGRVWFHFPTQLSLEPSRGQQWQGVHVVCLLGAWIDFYASQRRNLSVPSSQTARRSVRLTDARLPESRCGWSPHEMVASVAFLWRFRSLFLAISEWHPYPPFPRHPRNRPPRLRWQVERTWAHLA